MKFSVILLCLALLLSITLAQVASEREDDLAVAETKYRGRRQKGKGGYGGGYQGGYGGGHKGGYGGGYQGGYGGYPGGYGGYGGNGGGYGGGGWGW